MDLNTANVQTIAKLVGIERAYDLYLWRPYLSWEEVEGVPGFDRARVRRLKAAGAKIKLPGDPRTRRDEQNLSR
jgi:DNA uptake protein ComE-like DNA-binding protein